MTTLHWNLSPEKIAQYRDTALRRQKERQPAIDVRKDRAWALTQQAARLLREQYQATRIVVFGSLIHEGCFNQWSDIDIAAWGIPAEMTFRAMGAVSELDKQQEIDLVDIHTCPASLLAVIEKEGQDI